MSEKGFILLHRSIQNHWIYEEKRIFSRYEAWLDLLMLVNHKDSRVLQDNELIEVKRGERITSIRHLMDRWDWSNTKVVKFLELLQRDEMILFETTARKKTRIKILQYEKYQGFEQNDQSAKKTVETQSYQWFERNDQSAKKTGGFSNDKKNHEKTITETTVETQSYQWFDVTSVQKNNHRNDRETTQKRINNNDNNDNKLNNTRKRTKRIYEADSDEMFLVNFFISEIRKNDPKFKEPNKQTWADEFRKLIELDQRDKSEISKLIRWVQQDSFWKSNILSPRKLKKKYSALVIKMNDEQSNVALETTPIAKNMLVEINFSEE